jgi:hypothetical protein
MPRAARSLRTCGPTMFFAVVAIVLNPALDGSGDGREYCAEYGTFAAHRISRIWRACANRNEHEKYPMGLLSKLFGGKTANPNTARAEIDRRMDAAIASKSSDGEGLFMTVVGATRFFQPAQIVQDSETRARLLSDPVLFELAMFRIFSADSYMFVKHPQYRDRYVQFLFAQTVALFQPFLGLDDDSLAEVMNDRMALYGETFARGGEPMSNLMQLTQIIGDTVANGAPRTGLFSRPPSFEDIFDYLAVQMGLTKWDTKVLPIVCQGLDSFVVISRSNGL